MNKPHRGGSVTPDETADFLRRFNAWRRGGSETMPDPLEIGHAIDVAVERLDETERLRAQNAVLMDAISAAAALSGSLPTERPSVEKAMSEALERVIAEQQKEIDRLRLMEKNNNERWQHENKLVERMALAAFSVLNHPESPECHFELKQAVMAMGFCPRCEWRPCECESQYDD